MVRRRYRRSAVILAVGKSCFFGPFRVKLIATGNPANPVRSEYPGCDIENGGNYSTAKYAIPDGPDAGTYQVRITKCPANASKIVVLQNDRFLLVHEDYLDDENVEPPAKAPEPSYVIPARPTPKKVYGRPSWRPFAAY